MPMTETELAQPGDGRRPTETERVADDLLRRIEAGEFGPGQSLPSISHLIREYKSSMAPVRSALSELSHLGAIDTQPGQTARVRTPRPPVRRYGSRAAWEKARAVHWDDEVRGATGATEHATGLSKEELAFDISYERCSLDADLATLFAVAVSSPALRRNYHTMKKETGETLGMSTSYLLMIDIAGHPPLLDASNEPWPGATMHQLRQVGIEVSKVEDVTTTRPPTIEERETLGMRRGETVVQTRKTMWDTQDRVVEIAYAVLPGDSATLIYVMELAPWPVSHNDDVDDVIRHARRGR